MKQKTNEQFLKELRNVNNMIEPLEEYKGRSNKIRCRCKKCGNEWYPMPYNLLNGTGCRNCANVAGKKKRKRTAEEFISEVAEQNPDISIVGEYVNMRTKITVKCIHCDYKWDIRPDHALKGTKCPRCAGNLGKTEKQFSLQLKKTNNKVKTLTEYVNAKTKIQCECLFCGHTWSALPNKLLAGNGCPECDKRNKTSFAEQAIYYYLRIIYPDSSNRFLLHSDGEKAIEIDIYIKSLSIGIEYDGVYWHRNKQALEERKYKVCKKNDIKLIRIREGDSNGKEPYADYVINRIAPYTYESLDTVIDKLFEFLNLEMDVDTYRDANSIRGQFYKELKQNSLQHKYPDVAKEWYYEGNAPIKPMMVLGASNDKYLWKCNKCDNIWSARICDRTLRRRGCPVCAREKMRTMHKKGHEDFLNQLKMSNPDILPLEEYNGNHTPIKVRCKICGHEWKASPANLYKGRHCRMCTIRNGNKKEAITTKQLKESLDVKCPNISLIEEYKNKKTSLYVKCSYCGYEWKAMPMTIITNGTHCPKCKDKKYK